MKRFKMALCGAAAVIAAGCCECNSQKYEREDRMKVLGEVKFECGKMSADKNIFAVKLADIPSETQALKVKIDVEVAKTAPDREIVFACEISQNGKAIYSAPIRKFVDDDDFEMLLEPFGKIDPAQKADLKVIYKTSDPACSYKEECEVKELEVEYVRMLAEAYTVENSPGYNSWPMTEFLGDKLVCTYSRGSKHAIGEFDRGVFARVSCDGGKTWEEETCVVNSSTRGEVPIGKGLDENGNMLLWVRDVASGTPIRHALYRTRDGKKFEEIARPDLPDNLVQMTDILHIPAVGMVSFFFGGSYANDAGDNYWGKMISCDNGRNWDITMIETGLTKKDWPTEPSAIYLGDGKIFIIARTENEDKDTTRAQFQIISTDNGKTWKRSRTNITDVLISTPSLIYDKETNILYNYYYQRGRGILHCRKVDMDFIWDNPLRWSEPETIFIGSDDYIEAGNVNAAYKSKMHYLSFYSGTLPDVAVKLGVVRAE